MKIGQFALNLVVAFISFGVLHALGNIFIYGGALESMSEYMRSADDPQQQWIRVGHLLQTAAMVYLWLGGFATNNLRGGAVFGMVYGTIIAATNMVWWSSIKLPVDGMVVSIISGVIIGGLVGMILAKLYDDGREKTLKE